MKVSAKSPTSVCNINRHGVLTDTGTSPHVAEIVTIQMVAKSTQTTVSKQTLTNEAVQTTEVKQLPTAEGTPTPVSDHIDMTSDWIVMDTLGDLQE